MDSILHDNELRQALHKLYMANFAVLREHPDVFTNADATRMLTGLMGSRPWSWRVIGITRNALEVFARNDFQRPAGKIQRGHRDDRASTARALFREPDAALSLEEFFNVFLQRDETVLMTVEENKHQPDGTFPDFIPIERERQVFPCGTLVGWQHRKQEVQFLRDLYSQVLDRKNS
jgi:hypothetical protein